MPTEAQAKLMYCPMQRHSEPNRDEYSDACKGSSCMAWQWTTTPHLKALTKPINDEVEVELPESYEPPNKDNHGESWFFAGTYFDSEEAEWYGEWRRGVDPNQLGVCGLIPKHQTTAIEELLEDISNTLGKIAGGI